MTAGVVLALLLAPSAAELFQQGSALFRLGRYSEAASQFERAVEAEPKNPGYAKALGVSYAAVGDYQRANAPLGRACALEPRTEDACYFYGRNLYELNRYDQALAVLKKATRFDRKPWRVHLAIAQALEGLDRSAEAEAEFRTAVLAYESLSPDQRTDPDLDPRLHYCTYLYRQARLDEALALAGEVTKFWPGYGRGHFELGRILHQMGKLDQAAVELERAVRGSHGRPAELLLGRVYMRLGRKAEAERLLKGLAEPVR